MTDPAEPPARPQAGAEDHAPFLRRAFALAREAIAAGDGPYGAVLVVDGEIVAEGRNDTVTSRHPTRHAEVVCLQSAAARYGPEIFTRAILYASTEPCLMCAGAAYWCRVPTIVFGCHAVDVGDSPQQRGWHPPIEETLGRTARVIGPVLEKEALAVHLEHREQLNLK